MSDLDPSQPVPDQAPRAVYTAQLAARRAAVAVADRQHIRMGNLRLGVVAAWLVVAFLAWGAHRLPAELLYPVVAIYLGLALGHDRILRRKQRAERAVTFYEAGFRRLDHTWQGNGNPGTRFADDKHPYSGDLDLFGVGSLYELLCTARTRQGETLLADWLRGPADTDTLRERQEAVRELRANLALREDLFVIGDEVRATLDVGAVAAWGREPAAFDAPWLSSVARLLTALALAASLTWATHLTNALPFLVVALAEIGFLYSVRRRMKAALTSVSRVSGELEIFAELLARMEQERFQAVRLCALMDVLGSTGGRASQQLRRLQRLVELLAVTDSTITKPLNVILLWNTHLALLIDRWRQDHGRHIGDWLRVAGELEALCALAGYAYEHPEDVFPEIVSERRLLAEGMAHPLLDTRTAIRNDVHLDTEQRCYVISGSNMSGKSTLLRAVGVNVVLALAGAPVRATRFQCCPLHVGASLRTNDSLQAGISRFYAEILRLRQIVELADASLPLLFLLDEILHGTNSHDRRIGAEAVIRALLNKGAVGFVTTHDLALAEIAGEQEGGVVNVHLQDELRDGKMTFDYRLRPGVVTQSNALALMRAVGLEI